MKKSRYYVNKPEKEKQSTNDPFAGPAPISEERKQLYKRGYKCFPDEVRDLKLKSYLKSVERSEKNAVNQATRYELLLTEEAGFIEADERTETWTIKQQEIAEASDIASANKFFQLTLDQFGPYRIDYTRNGRYLLLAGQRGHVAAFDWMSKKLMCEMNVMEATADVKWLQTENMFAVAQRKWVHIYDNQGLEIHCLKRFNDTLCLDFLPYHWLLVATNCKGFLQYLDVSVGEIIATINTKGGRLDVMGHNPNNGVVMLGHHNGTVTMWSPNQKDALAKVLCHRNAIRALAVDNQGNYLATSGQDGRLRIFDLRTYKPLHTYKLSMGASNLNFSQRGVLATSCQNVVEIYKDPCIEMQEKPYLSHTLKHSIHDVMFCPFEDVLGVGSADGFASLLVPGAGEPNFDSNELNPHRSKKQRREWEVKALLEKIQPDLISLDPTLLGKVDHVTAERLQKDKEERLGYKPEVKKFVPRVKKKGKNKPSSLHRRKSTVRGALLRDKIVKEKEEKLNKLKELSGTIATKNNTEIKPPDLVQTRTTALSRFL